MRSLGIFFSVRLREKVRGKPSFGVLMCMGIGCEDGDSLGWWLHFRVVVVLQGGQDNTSLAASEGCC